MYEEEKSIPPTFSFSSIAQFDKLVPQTSRGFDSLASPAVV
jgi:hypothetical protein